ncbi:MAG: ABC transporter permease [Candidatus Bathyarchaeia archaeon]
MFGYIFRKLLTMPPILVGVTACVFLIIRLIPGDPARAIAGPDAAQEDIEVIRREFGLDRPLYVQYANYLFRLLKGDFGRSYRTRRPVLEEIGPRLAASMILAFPAAALALAIAIPFGTLAAIYRGTFFDSLLTGVTLLGVSVPNFVLGLGLMYFFSVKLKWLPPTGCGGVEYIILPILTMTATIAGPLVRLMRSSMLEVLFQDYVRVARAKGLRERRVLFLHALRNALIPVITVLGVTFSRLVGAAVIIETIFAWPGLGRYLVNAIELRDYVVVQQTLLIFITLVIANNTLVDILCALIDPRIQLI